jgi:epoxide hydrolase A/B
MEFMTVRRGEVELNAACTDFRGLVLVPRAGHWVQQEAPVETNAALERFLDGLK